LYAIIVSRIELRKKVMKESKVYIVMGRDEYGQYQSSIGEWSIIKVADNEAAGLALVEELKRDDPYSGYKLVAK
jgi:hypothetical protein